MLVKAAAILTHLPGIAHTRRIALGIRDLLRQRRRGIAAEAFGVLDGGDGVALSQAGRQAGALALEGVCPMAGQRSGAAEAAEE